MKKLRTTMLFDREDMIDLMVQYVEGQGYVVEHRDMNHEGQVELKVRPRTSAEALEASSAEEPSPDTVETMMAMLKVLDQTGILTVLAEVNARLNEIAGAVSAGLSISGGTPEVGPAPAPRAPETSSLGKPLASPTGRWDASIKMSNARMEELRATMQHEEPESPFLEMEDPSYE